MEMQQLLANQEKAVNAKANQEVLLARMEAEIDINRETDYDAVKEMQTKNERHGERNTFYSRQNVGRQKTNREEMKATIKSTWSELDETIQQQVGNIVTHNQETQSLQKACQGTTTWHEAMEAYCKIGNIVPLLNPRAKCEMSDISG
jgi:predicted component of type VI protein secretion system